jgi:hypothetical protein
VDNKAVCAIVFEDHRLEKSVVVAGAMEIGLRLESWETTKEPKLRRFIVSKEIKVYQDAQYALGGMNTDSTKKSVHEANEIYLCPSDTTPSDAIRIALGMWEDPNPVRELFDSLCTRGALLSKQAYKVQEP